MIIVWNLCIINVVVVVYCRYRNAQFELQMHQEKKVHNHHVRHQGCLYTNLDHEPIHFQTFAGEFLFSKSILYMFHFCFLSKYSPLMAETWNVAWTKKPKGLELVQKMQIRTRWQKHKLPLAVTEQKNTVLSRSLK